jgi:hypothetical protein
MSGDSTLSRRRLLASVPALAATMAPASGTALSVYRTGTENDPVFSAIERHRVAFGAYQQAKERHRDARKAFEARRDPRGVYLYDAPETTLVVEYPDGGRVDFRDINTSNLPNGERCNREIYTGHTVAVFADNPRHIRQADEDCIECADFEVWQDQKLEELLQWRGCYDDLIGAARELEHHAFECLVAATAELNTRPTTLAGTAALLRTIAQSYDGDNGDIWDGTVYGEHDEDGDVVGDPILDNNGLLLEILKTLAEAVQSIHA